MRVREGCSLALHKVRLSLPERAARSPTVTRSRLRRSASRSPRHLRPHLQERAGQYLRSSRHSRQRQWISSTWSAPRRWWRRAPRGPEARSAIDRKGWRSQACYLMAGCRHSRSPRIRVHRAREVLDDRPAGVERRDDAHRLAGRGSIGAIARWIAGRRARGDAEQV